jgi:ATP-dependent helicase/nuclease subunit B
MSDRPAIFTIPASLSLVEVLAKGLLAQYGDDPLALSRALIFLPTRRAARTLREAFLRQSNGKALLLPRILPLGDVDDDDPALAGVLPGARGESLPPAISSLERTLLLSHLVQAWHRARSDDTSVPDPDQAFRLAAELGRLLDQMQTEGLALNQLHDLVTEDFANHWQVTIEFLQIVGDEWPGALATLGKMDLVDRRNQTLAALAEHWQKTPPTGPVIAAGSTGSIPATAALLKVIAYMPQGQVILPGFDEEMDAASWDALDASHPQAGMRQLLGRIEASREDIQPWPHVANWPPQSPARQILLREAMRPAQTTDQWRHLDKPTLQEALGGLFRIEADSTRGEADAIALIMREALETPGKTAALITPDRELARRTAAALRRWDIEIDDSAGLPLSGTPVATFMQLVVEMCLENFAPVPLLATLKHPLCALGEKPSAFRAAARRLERTLLRGPRPAAGTVGISHGLEHADCPDGLPEWWQGFADACAPLSAIFSQEKAPLAELIKAHISVAESLACTDEKSGADNLWRGQAGEALSTFLEDLLHHADRIDAITPQTYPALLGAALVGQAIRPQWGKHPRLSILGPLEARLHHAHITILGGLNEGSWPPDPGSDPWLSRPMKQQVGLAPPEQRIGLSAHDFIHGAASGEVYLTRATRAGGAPTMPSRWLLRLDAVTEGLQWQRPNHTDWARQLDEATPAPPLAPPRPKPALNLRPDRLSATQIETWMRDPYAIYARKILRLDALAPLDEQPGAREQGIFIHDALENYIKKHPGPPPADAVDLLLQYGRDAFGDIDDRPGVHSFWWPRFEQIAAWFIDQQEKRQGIATPVLTEERGTITLNIIPDRPFIVTAIADRIDQYDDGSFEIIDYKTGTPPTVRQVDTGYGPQLPLEALILEAGGFPGIKADAEKQLTGNLSYWRLRGGTTPSKIDAFSNRRKQKEIPTLIEEAERGLHQLITAFAQEDTPYLSHPNPAESGWGDYDHLARVKEWEAQRHDK